MIVVLWLRKLRCLHDVRHDCYLVMHLVFELRRNSCRLPFSVEVIIGWIRLSYVVVVKNARGSGSWDRSLAVKKTRWLRGMR